MYSVIYRSGYDPVTQIQGEQQWYEIAAVCLLSFKC